MRNTFVDAVLKASKKKDNIFIITGDAGLGVFDEFKKDFPGRFLNLGVAEQNAASFTAGMALAGFKMYMYNIIPFLLYRCYEQVRNDICYQKLPVVLVGIGSGVTYAPQGMTHYSVEDLGIAQTLPNMYIFSPADPFEAESAALYSLDAKMPVYVRLAKKGEANIHKTKDMDILLPQVIEDGERVGIVFHGSIGCEVMRAGELLRRNKISPRLITVPLIQPLNTKALSKMLKGIEHVVTVEEHFVNCGLGSILSRMQSETSQAWKLHCLGIPAVFIHEIKDLEGMRDFFGISGEKIARYIKAIVKGKDNDA
jgi:transketolase